MATVNVRCDKFYELESKPEDLMIITRALEKGGVTVNIRCEEPETLRWLSQLPTAERQPLLDRWRMPLLFSAGLVSSLVMMLYGLSTL